MRKLTYFAVFEPTDKGFSVYFPDLPGCATFGQNYQEALLEAKDALSLHIYGMEKDGDLIPEPSQNPTLDPETNTGYIVTPITIFPDLIRNELDNRAVKTNLTIPSWLKELAEARGVNYSKLLQAALMEYLGINQPPQGRNLC
ncbi:MAG: type II toxin-antitoxin system HicB family antitoxin [Bacillota bacterium]|nr:type II toxin-antitoxin system HicB family antitoxin [Bacillota bacterium]MDW7730730.1 type II toxin-antitoxin system HicB family antitoxin [Bacillota bacterium]